MTRYIQDWLLHLYVFSLGCVYVSDDIIACLKVPENIQSKLNNVYSHQNMKFEYYECVFNMSFYGMYVW